MRRMCVLLVAVGVGIVGALPATAAPWVGTRSVTGALDTVSSDGPSVTLTGWARDPGSTQPVEIHVYDKGPEGTTGYSWYKATVSRPDVARALGGSAAAGYVITLPLSAGTHEICAFAIGRSSQSLLGCRSITAPPPFGVIDGYQDATTVSAPTVGIAGWAIDPALRSASLAVHVYDYAPDGQVTAAAFESTVPRPDVAAALGSGPTPGFEITAPLSATIGDHRVCVFAISATGGANGVLDCLIVTVFPNVLGALDVAVPAAVGAVGLAGWAIDPLDAVTPVQVGFTGTLTPDEVADASLERPDVAAVFPGAGANHGFISLQGVGLGTSEVCAVTTVNGDDTIGCGTVVMENGLGNFDRAAEVDGSIELSGWTLDPYYAAEVESTPLVIQVVADGGAEPQVFEVLTDEERSDVNAAFGVVGNHGFGISIGDGQLAPGEYTVNAWAPLLFASVAANPDAGVPFATVQVTVS